MNNEEVINPYIDARREWNERYGDYITQVAIWRVVAVVAMLLAIVAVGGVVYLAGKSQFIPYVVEVDGQGRATPIGPVMEASKTDTRVINALLVGFIKNLREVTADIEIQKRRIYNAYSHIPQSEPSNSTINEYFRANDPFERARKENVIVEVNTPLHLGSGIWQVEWIETRRDLKGATLGKSRRYQAVLHTLLEKASNEIKRMQANPIGLYIRELNWSAMLDAAKEEK